MVFELISFSFWRRCQLAKMSKSTKSVKSLTEKLNRPEKTVKHNVEDQKVNEAVTSQYFSPRKTRNRIKIEYEKPNVKTATKPEKKRLIKTEEKTATLSNIDEISAEIKKEKPSKKPAKRQLIKSDEATTIKTEKEIKWEPEHWKEIIENLKIMRKNVPAPVDTMGCDQCPDENADDKTKRFHKLVALMLSAQTKDQVTYDAIIRLKAKGLTPENVVTWKTSEFEELLKPVSFYKNKAKHIQKASQILIDNYNSDIPNTLEGLMKLPGVGPKMAHICMNSAWNIISGIGVDVHVHRISNRLKWVRKPTKQPEETRTQLESWLPSEHWSEINMLLVGFGQTICSPINPKCELCLNNRICPSAFISKKKSPKKRQVKDLSESE